MKYKLNFKAKIINMEHPFNKAIKTANDIFKYVEADCNYFKQTLNIFIETGKKEPTKELINNSIKAIKKNFDNSTEIKLVDVEYVNCEAIIEAD